MGYDFHSEEQVRTAVGYYLLPILNVKERDIKPTGKFPFLFLRIVITLEQRWLKFSTKVLTI